MANCNRQQLNITCRTDVVLHDRLIFDGETFDPSLSVGIVANLVTSMGKRNPLNVEVEGDELVISIPWVEGRNPGCYGLEVTGTCNSKKWSTYADSLIRYTKATRHGAGEVTVESDYYDITMEVGYRYGEGGNVNDVLVNGGSVVQAGKARITMPTKVSDLPNDADYATQEDVEESKISEVEATIDDNVGTPEVEATLEGHKLTLAFQNLLGDGIASIEQTTRSEVSGGVNVFTVTTVGGKVATFEVRNGAKGDTVILGEGVVYTLYNGTGQNTDGAMTQNAVTRAIEADDIPIIGSQKLIKSGGVFNKGIVEGIYLNTNYAVRTAANTACIVKSVKAGEKYYLYVENSALVNTVRRIAFFTEYTTNPDTPISTLFYSSPETFYELTAPANARQIVICCHWTDNSGDPSGYHLLTSDEYFLYLKEYNRATGVESKKLSVDTTQSFTDAEKVRGLANLGITIGSEITPNGDFLLPSKVLFDRKIISGYIASNYTFHQSNDLSAYSAIVKKVNEGEKYYLIIDTGTISNLRRIAFYASFSDNDTVENPILHTSADEENKWYELVVPIGAKYMAIQTRFTYSGQEGVGNPKGYRLYSEDEYMLLINRSNKLFGKTIAWFGSSIDEGFGQYPYTEKYGWTTPLQRDYGAICDNQAHSGATIRNTTESTGRHCIVNDIISYVNALPSYAPLDYIIFGGGGNDRDPSSAWGTVSANNYVEYPDNDMSYTTSALENLCSFLQGNERLKNVKFGMVIRYTANDSDTQGWEPAHWNELADRMIQVLEKWGIPYLDLRKTCGFTLCSAESRKIYSTDLTTFDGDYDETAEYSADQRCKYEGAVYRANQSIAAPAGEWDASKWIQISDDNGYDKGHINRFAYDKTSNLVASWIMSL